MELTSGIELNELEDLIRRAFAEDSAHFDITTLACIGDSEMAAGNIILKQDGCIAGLTFLPWIFHLFDPRIETKISIREGSQATRGTLLASLKGPARSLLSAERVALNFLQHLSGIATLTARCVAQVAHTPCHILDTRKTLLGLRSLQKYAVRTGGGTNHRLHLGDRILIKNNHLALAPLGRCLQQAKTLYPLKKIEVEVRSSSEMQDALEGGADAILLDNMTLEEVKLCVELNQKRAFLEASGGMKVDTIAAYAETGIDAISIGALTHSAPALDIALRVTRGNYEHKTERDYL